MVSWPVFHVDLAVGPDSTTLHSVGRLLLSDRTTVKFSSCLASIPLCVSEASGEMPC